MNVRELKKTVDNLCVIVVNIASTGRLTFNGRTAQREKKDTGKEKPVEKMTQAERVYNHLKEHGFITNMQCHLLYGIRHCPSVIRDIKKKLLYEGSLFYIDTEPQKGCDRYGNKVNWVKYLLKEKSLCVNLQ